MAAVVFPRLGVGARQFLKARWSMQLLEVLGVRMIPAGAPPRHGLVVANHISWLDIFAINAVAPTVFLSKDEVRHWPIIGWLSTRAGTLFLERGSRTAAQRARAHLVEELRNGSLVGVFPESTTGFGDHVMPFHGALFQSAIDAGVVVTPTLLRYTDARDQPSIAAAYVGETSLWECIRSIANASGLTVSVTFLPIVETSGADRRHLAHHSRQIISHALAAVTPSREAPLDASMATETPVRLPGERQSGGHPTGNPSPAPADSSHA
jgi:1-acyl-sn-glycerol-3-phosphate acyltransferase